MTRPLALPRRALLRALGLSALASAMSSGVGFALAQKPAGGRRKVLVVLFQRGAVDGLSMVPPVADERYYQLRPPIAVPPPGKPAGALWHPPYRLDITKLLKPGQNHIEIDVYNTALNAWSALPPHDYKPLIAKYGDRFQMQDLDKVTPISSGILGSIHLVTEESK